MAKNHLEPEKMPTVESSSDEEETSSEESESEPELTRKPAAAIKPRPQPLQPQPSSDSESESESDSEDANQKVDPVPPMSAMKSKPAADPVTPATESESESDSEDANQKGDPVPPKSAMKSKPAADPVTPATVKRPAEETPSDSKTSRKKSKKHAEPEPSAKQQTEPETSTKKQPAGDESSKKPLFQRIWSAKDEIVVLKGLTEYATEKKSDPVADLSAFLDFIKKDLEFVDVSTLQLHSKLRRLKIKFHNNHVKEKEGKLRTPLSNPHEQKSYDLSKLFWGKAEEEKEVIASDAKREEKMVIASDAKRVMRLIPRKLVGGDADERIQRMGDEMFVDGTEDAEEWKLMKIEEAEAYTRHLEVKTRQSKFVMEKWRSAGN